MINEKTYEKIRKYLAAVSKGRHKAMGSAPEHAVFVDKEQALVVGHFSCFRVPSDAAEEELCFTELPDFKFTGDVKFEKNRISDGSNSILVTPRSEREKLKEAALAVCTKFPAADGENSITVDAKKLREILSLFSGIVRISVDTGYMLSGTPRKQLHVHAITDDVLPKGSEAVLMPKKVH